MNFKNLREKRGLSQSAIAEKIGVSQATISMWETGEAMPRVDKLPEIAKILNCDINDLFAAKK